MSVLDFRGPEFLAFFAGFFVSVLCLCLLARWLLRLPGGIGNDMEAKLSPYQIAYLAGGAELAANAALARLAMKNCIIVDDVERKLSLGETELPNNAPAIEKAIISEIAQGEESTNIATVRKVAMTASDELRGPLADRGLLVASGQAAVARFLPLLLYAVVPLLGALKIHVGMSRNRPVEFLIGATILAGATGLLVFGRSVWRSRRGDSVLRQLRDDNDAIVLQAMARPNELVGDDIITAVALLGLGGLAIGPIMSLQTALRPKESALGAGIGGGSCSSGCSSGCGGGCGGGGCGGCGG